MNIVIKVDEETKQKMISFYQNKKRDKIIPYVIFQADNDDTVITLYESGKAMFQGISADVDASMWQEINKINKTNDSSHDEKYYNCNSYGSDEVGTGDYFGPIVVTASYVSKNDIPFLENLGVKDSKKLTDDKILKIAPQIVNKIKYRSIIINNEEYNQKYDSNTNMNKIKSIMHNKVLYKLIDEEKFPYDYIIIDEFAKESRYYDYIKESAYIKRGITFLTKAEDKNLAVACSSIISRFIFLKEFNKLSDSIHLPLVKGAGNEVDKIGEEAVEKYGPEILKKISKYNFQNTKRILKTSIF